MTFNFEVSRVNCTEYILYFTLLSNIVQVVEFVNERQRTLFKQTLSQALAVSGSTLECHETKIKHIYRRALTQKKRNQYLEKFFKTVFSEVM